MGKCSRCGTDMEEVCPKCGFKIDPYAVKQYILHEPDVGKLKEILQALAERLQHLDAMTQ